MDTTRNPPLIMSDIDCVESFAITNLTHAVRLGPEIRLSIQHLAIQSHFIWTAVHLVREGFTVKPYRQAAQRHGISSINPVSFANFHPTW